MNVSGEHRDILQPHATKGPKSHVRGPSLITDQEGLRSLSTPSQVPFPVTSPTVADSPISPNYPKTLQHDHHHTHHCHDHHDPDHPDHHGDGHHHSHTHGHDHEGHSHNMRGVFLHVMADTLGSVGVIISTLLIQYYGWTGFDPIASIFIALLIAASVIPLVIDTGRVLSLDLGDNEKQVRQALSEVRNFGCWLYLCSQNVSAFPCRRCRILFVSALLAKGFDKYYRFHPHTAIRFVFSQPYQSITYRSSI